jgi:hypothetical protein
MRVTGPNTDTKYAQMWDALSHKVNEYKQYLNEKSTHLTRSIPHAGFKFKFLHIQQLLNVSLDSIHLILREKDLTTKVFTDDGNQMVDFIHPVEVKSDTSTSPSQDLFIDTLAVLLVPDHETVSPEEEKKLIQVSRRRNCFPYLPCSPLNRFKIAKNKVVKTPPHRPYRKHASPPRPKKLRQNYYAFFHAIISLKK